MAVIYLAMTTDTVITEQALMKSIALSPRAYAIAFILVTVFTSTGIALLRLFKISKCDSSGYSEEYYLAYCRNDADLNAAYGDYEHGLFYYGLDDTSINNLRTANVVVLGNSRAQDAFSSKALGNYFRSHGLSYFLLGFAHGEQDLFPQQLFKRYALKPRVIIINADPFFNRHLSKAGKRVLSGTLQTRFIYAYKKRQQSVHAYVCNRSRQAWLKAFMCGNKPTIYRSRINGTWLRKSYDVSRSHPVAIHSLAPPKAIAIAASLQSSAKRFVSRVVQDGTCLVLTFVPWSLSAANRSPLVAESLARQLGVHFVFPHIDGLYTFDQSHMNRDNAERWGRAFASEFDRVLPSCTATHQQYAAG